MPAATAADLLDTLRRDHLLDAAQLAEAGRTLGAGAADARGLARELVRRGWLTPYQVNQLFRPDGRPLLIGSYVLLDKLGEGGMGAVFKARSWKLGRVVAMKLIRKDRLDSEVAVKRFRREIQAAARLDHPNIVHAYDADEAGGLHFLVMEFVEGTDLARLLKQRGPLPVAPACDYARQAALGLQHAFEQGMVHRDIKPANLLLTAAGVVKVMDFGLARLSRSKPAGDESGTMTQEGAVMGSLDYIAPEQAVDAHSVDTRADVYALGCTLFHLLTGRVPFPGGEALGKLLKHRLEEPEPVERLRPDVPPAVAAVVRRLMAKRPDDRYQTPAEVVAALDTATDGGTSATEIIPAAAPAEVSGDTAADWAALDTPLPIAARPPARDRRLLWLSAAGGLSLLLGLAVLVAVLMRSPNAPAPDTRAVAVATPKEAGHRPEPADDQWVKATAALPAEKQVEAVVAKLKELNPGHEGQVVPGISDGVVFSLTVPADGLTTIAPFRALAGLRELALDGTAGKCRLADLSALKGLRLTDLRCQGLQVADLSPLAGMPLVSFTLNSCPVDDLRPLTGLPLTNLICVHCAVKDVTPLEGLPLANLTLQDTQVADLAPLRNMRLESLGLTSTRVTDLSPLAGMPLHSFGCSWTGVNDLTPLRGMPLTHVDISVSGVNDLSPLKGMPLETVVCDFSAWRKDDEILRPITTLKTINGKPAADFWAALDTDRAAFDAWAKTVAPLKPDEQGRSVVSELKRRNPGFDGQVKSEIRDGAFVGLEMVADDLTDLAPLRALPRLQGLGCVERKEGKSQLSDLWPLHGLGLTGLNITGTRVADLSPLKGMPLTYLRCPKTPVADLSPLRDLPLTTLDVIGTKVTDLSPLRGKRLTYLSVGFTGVADLSPLKEMPLEFLHCKGMKAHSLSALAGMPLKHLDCDFSPWRDTELLRSIKSLNEINDRPAAEFWKKADADRAEFDAWVASVAKLPAEQQIDAVKDRLTRANPEWQGTARGQVRDGAVATLDLRPGAGLRDLGPVRALPGLKELIYSGGPLDDLWPLHGLRLTRLYLEICPVQDLTALREMPLEQLTVLVTQVADLSPLKGMPLTSLMCGHCPVSDLSPLRGMRLEQFDCRGLAVSDLSVLKGMPLTFLCCIATRVADLSPLEGMPLTSLNCANTRVADLTPLKGLPLVALNCGGTRVADLSPLAGLHLQELHCNSTAVSDLSPLKDMPLATINIAQTRVTDLSPLAGLPIKTLAFNVRPGSDAAVLRAMKSLDSVNGKPAAQFWKDAGLAPPTGDKP
jgi:Leucine-rich repeat (LRR) protein/tRNA A-37 threonylcarbamoyl transferase component Bud32